MGEAVKAPWVVISDRDNSVLCRRCAATMGFPYGDALELCKSIEAFVDEHADCKEAQAPTPGPDLWRGHKVLSERDLSSMENPFPLEPEEPADG